LSGGAQLRPSEALWMISPVWLLLAAVVLLPSAYILWLSFEASSFGQAARFVGLDNYRQVLGDAYFWRALRNTLVVVVVVVHVEVAAGLAMALLFASGLRWRPFWLAVVLAPYAVSEVSAVIMWRFLMEPDVGLITRLLAAIGVPPLDWALSPWAGLALVCLISIWLTLPFTFVLLYAARLALPADVYEAARVDGAGPWQQFRAITWPLLRPAILVAMLFRYIIAFRLFSEVWLTTGGGPARTTEVVALYLYVEGFRYNAFGVASATGWLMVVLAFAFALLYLRRFYAASFRTA
jgi:multiple sugar transport system permease protein